VGTENLTDLRLYVLYKHNPIFDIGFIDYAGGALVFDKKENEPQAIEIQQTIWESDALLVILDSVEIFNEDLDTIKANLGLDIIRQIFESLFINHKMDEFTAAPFVLTKVDELRRLIKTEEDKVHFIQKCTDLVDPLASPFIDAGIPTGYFPVSAIGLDAHKPVPEGPYENINPLWVENPILFCVDKWMHRESLKLQKALENLNNRKKSPLHGIIPAYFTEKLQEEKEKKGTEIKTKIQFIIEMQGIIHSDYNVEMGVFNTLTGTQQLQNCIDEIS
jgi:hypothetical protein